VVSIPDITMYETLVRPHEIAQASALPHVDTVAKKLQRLERKREDKRLRQIAASRAHHAEKRKREESLARADATDSSCELEPKGPRLSQTATLETWTWTWMSSNTRRMRRRRRRIRTEAGGGCARIDRRSGRIGVHAAHDRVNPSTDISAGNSGPLETFEGGPWTHVFLTFACLLPAQTLAQEKVSDPSSAQIIKQEHDDWLARERARNSVRR